MFLYAFILALPVKVPSSIVLIRSRHSLLCGILAHPCDASAAQHGQPLARPSASMSADNTWSLLGSTSGILSTTILANGSSSFFARRNFLCQGQVQSDRLPRRHKPSQFVASHASFSGCIVHIVCFAHLHSWQYPKTAPV